MSTVLGQAQIILTADTARFTSEINNARNLSVNSFADIKRSAQEIAKVSLMGVVAGATAGATALAAMTTEQVKLANELSKTAQVANTSVAAIQKYTFAAKAAGIEQDKLADIFKDTQDKVGDFLSTGGGELQDFFKNVAPQANLTADALRKMSGPEALQAMYNAMDKANLSQSEMVFYMEGIADEASSLIPLLADGGAGFKLWADTAENAGAVMDEKTIRASQELRASTDLLNLSYQGVKNQLTQALIPVLSDLAGDLVKDANLKNQAKAAGDGLATSFKFIAKTGLGAVATFDMMGTALGGLLAMIGQLGNGVDWNSPYAFFQMGKNFLANNKAAAQIGVNVLDDLSKKLDSYATKMEYIDKLGTNGTNATVSAYVKLNNTIDQQNAKLGKTGAQIQEQLEKEKELAKEREKSAKSLEKVQARLVGISGNSGIGSGAHLDIRVSGGARRLTAAELSRFQADGKPLTAYRKTSDYGYRGDIGVEGASKYHRGTDFAMPVGTPITSKVPIKNVSNFYDPKGGGYVQRVLFADGLSVDLLHQSPASKGIKGSASGIKSPYINAQNEAGQLITQQQESTARESQRLIEQQERAAKEQLDLQARLKAEYADEETKRAIEHQNKLNEIAKVNNAQLQKTLLAQEKVRYDNVKDLATLDYDTKIQKATEWQQTEEERIKNNAEIERRETRLTVGLHKDLVTARINEINAKEQAALQQARKGFEDELASINGYKTSDVDKIRADFDAKIKANDLRTDISPEQISTLREAMTGAKIDAIRIARKSAADPYNSMMADFDGTSELLNLQNLQNQRLEVIKKAKAEEVITTEQAEKAKAQIERQYQISRYDMMMSSGQQILGSVTSSLKATLGEHNKAYRVMFAIEKGVNIARSLMAINTGIAMAAANPFPMNLGAMVSVAAATASIVNDIMAIRNPVGQAHDGIMSVPESGTWNLQKGERVLPEYTAKSLDRTLDDVSKKGNGGGNVNIVFENHTSATISQAPSKDGEMRFIIRDEIDNYVPQQLSRTNSAISQALLQNTTATRRV